jgi:polar amino acid transport system substrate-binding protein
VTARRSAVAGNRRGLAAAALAVAVALGLAGCAAAAAEPMKPVAAPHVEPAGVAVLKASSTTPAQGPQSTCPDGGVDSIRPPNPMPAPGQMPGGTFMAKIKARGYLLAGVDQNTYQWGYRDPRTGELDGFDIDMVRMVAAAIFGSDVNHVHFVVVPNEDRAAAVQNGTVDIVAETMTVNCQRRKQVSFSAVYFVARQLVLVPAGSPITSDAALAGRRVCAVAGSTSLTNLAKLPVNPPVERVSVVNETDCLVLLQQGQIDAISTDDTILNGMAAQDPTLQLVGRPLSAEPYGMAINLHHPEFTAFVNGVLAQERSKAWGQTYAKWLPTTQGVPAMPTPSYEPSVGR